jgi:3-hydroxymyristoyl/3-hydroxydecanoyl-(acyl carrier protein) dehydratase/1-acyl-sn-glycerol-3-phosphate acyltransferase
VFGAAFRAQDAYRRQVRLPQPPLLLVDRVAGIAGDAGSLGRGTIWTETDVRADAWYLHQGHMPPGILIESGQADLLLISWLGVDALNRDERVYRLLGCELTFHGVRLPQPGDTLHYEIHVTGHAQTGDVRLFFFQYDCWIGNRRWISVRNGQAGFFTNAELIASGGVLWDAAADAPKANARLDPPPRVSLKRAFTRADVEAFVAGDAYACFGEGFEEAASHQRTPATPAGRMRLIDEVTAFDPHGGPWGRGYLRAESSVPVDAWFYDGHFKNDPCMPGTLMADAAVQAQSFLMAALGFTIARDGWRFEPVTDETYKFVCRGQVVPDAPHRLTYEVFVEEIEDGPEPRLHAALLCRCDGFKVFHCRRLGVRLVPDWPLSTRVDQVSTTQPHIVDPNGPVYGDYAALLACAWGRPSDAFGPMYAAFDAARRAPRLPGPPYHFMTQVDRVTCRSGAVTEGGQVTIRYDVPADAWYFDENASPAMPLAVLMEVMLQPCGWLASYMGIAANSPVDLRFRNLDGGNATVARQVRPDASSVTTTATLTRFARAGETTLVFFHVECRDRHGIVLAFDTSFGFFTESALATQSGLPAPSGETPDEGAPAIANLDVASLASLDTPDDDVPRLARGSLRMIDRVTAFWPAGGAAGLGRLRGQQTVRPESWYFKAHFYQDPVQPGSLGIEALVQLLQIGMRLKGLHQGMTAPMFEPIASGEPLVWRYRGQVVPRNRQVDTEIEITRIDRGDDGRIVCVAKGTLWCDGLRIYEMPSLAVSLVDTHPCTPERTPECSPEIVRNGWRRLLGLASWPGEALMAALFRRFVRRVSFSDPTAIAALAGRPVLYLANHQTGVESILFSFAIGGLTQRPVIALAKGEHQQSWLGRLYECLAAYPGVRLPRMALFFDREDRASMLALMREAGRLLQADGYSMLVHVEGTRSTRAGEPVRRVSAVLLDLMSAAQVPIVPVRFAGGLPVGDVDERREFPIGLGQQEIFIGAPIEIDALRDLPLRDKQHFIADAINTLGGPLASESPTLPSPDAEARVARLAAAAHLDLTKAVVLDAIAQDAEAATLFTRILDAVNSDGTRSTLTPWEQAFLDWATERSR